MAGLAKFSQTIASKLKSAGTGVPKLSSMPKLPKISMKPPKTPGGLKTKPFSFAKFWKAPKIPKAPKMKIVKASIKKFKK